MIAWNDPVVWCLVGVTAGGLIFGPWLYRLFLEKR